MLRPTDLNLDVPAATENPFDIKKCPYAATHMRFPIRTHTPKEDAALTAAALAGLFAVSTLGAWILLTASFTAGLVVFFAVFVVMPGMRRHVLALIAFVIAVVTALLGWPIAIWAFGLSVFFTVVLDFKLHYVHLATGGMVPQEVAFLFHNGAPPQYVPKESIIRAFLDSLVAYFAYNRIARRRPGTLSSPVGLIPVRYINAVACTLCISGLIASRFQNLELPATSPVACFGICVTPFLVWLSGCFIFGSRILAIAYALKRRQLSPQLFPAFTRDMGESPDPVEAKSLFLGFVAFDQAPIIFPLALLARHMWIVGKTGSRKTAYILMIMAQLIRRNDTSVFYLDMKGLTKEVLGSVIREADHASKERGTEIPVKHFTPDYGKSAYLVDIFSQDSWKAFSAEQKAGVILSALSLLHSRSFGESWYSDASFDVLLFVFDRNPDVKSWTELKQRIDQAVRFAKPYELSPEVKRDGTHISLIVNRLARQAAFNADHGHSPEVIRDAIDFGEAFDRPIHHYFSLSATKYPTIAGENGRLIAGAIFQAAAAKAKRKMRVVLIIDEFQVMVGQELEHFLTMARALDIGIILANQNVAQLQTKDADLLPIVEGNTSAQVWTMITDAQGQQQVTALGGKQVIHVKSESTTTNSEGNTGTSVTYSEHIVDRVSSTLIASVCSDPSKMLIRIPDTEGYACYQGLMFAASTIFHQTEAVYKACENMPWPPQTEGTLVNGPPPQTAPATQPAAANTPKYLRQTKNKPQQGRTNSRNATRTP